VKTQHPEADFHTSKQITIKTASKTMARSEDKGWEEILKITQELISTICKRMMLRVFRDSKSKEYFHQVRW